MDAGSSTGACCSCYYPPPMRAPCSRRKSFTLTLEPIVCVYFAIQVLTSKLVQNVLEYKMCVGEGDISSQLFSKLVGNETNSPFCRQNEVENFVSYYHLLESVCAILPCAFFGSWSDTHGRIALMILPVVGSALMNCVLLLAILVSEVSASWTLIAALPYGLSGGTTLFMLATCCYSCDISELCVRTGRISVVYTMGIMGSALGTLFAARTRDLLAYHSFAQVVGVICAGAVLLNLLIVLYIKMVVVETIHNSLGSYDGNSWCKAFKCSNVAAMVKSVFKARICDARKIIVTLNGVFLMFIIGQYGTNATVSRYLFYLNYNQAESQAVNDLSYMTQITGVLLMTAFMWKVDVKETTSGMIGSFLATLGALLLAIDGAAPAGLGVVIFNFSILIPLAVLSTLAKLVDTKETGTLFSALCVIDCLVAPCAGLLYGQIASTAMSLVWINFVITIWLFFLCIVGFGYIRYKMPSEYLENQVEFSERLPLLSRRNITKGAIM